MKQAEGIRRIVVALRAIGALILGLGIVVIDHQTQNSQLATIVMTGIFAAPFFGVAWIIDGFASREQRELDAMLAQWRRNYEMGRDALDRRPDA
jgi:hypothetical protein